ncbi:STAS domain-containing protein [Parafilimonas sp.]|uniref:STAS domain-containing protein n=1 Tax=Parafilimonas sp. TaxID=1969739 RepID=UPI003F7E47B1
MKFKIDTREKFTIITPDSDFTSDNLTAELKELLTSFLQHKTNLVINLKNVVTVKENLVKELAAWQQQFYEQQVSFVICELQLPVQAFINQLDLDSELNITPSETEAWDIVQMEEIERELLGDE